MSHCFGRSDLQQYINIRISEYIPDLVEIARPPNWSDFIGVVEKADAGLSQAVTLSDLDLTEAFDEVPPNI